jgi:hypothetical protein
MHVTPPFNVLNPTDPAVTRLHVLAAEHHPDLVIVNTLRKVHQEDDKESDVPSRVYGAFQAIFPGAAIWFTHHDKKTGDPAVARPRDEEFSGTQAWINDATVGLHLVRGGEEEGLLRLEHTKSQVSAQIPPVMLSLAKDGSNITLHGDRQLRQVVDAFASLDPALSKTERVKLTSQRLGTGFSERTVWSVLRRVEAEAAESLQRILQSDKSA